MTKTKKSVINLAKTAKNGFMLKSRRILLVAEMHCN